MPIPVSARAIMKVGISERQFSGTLAEQILRYLSLDPIDRRHTTITVSSVVDLPGWGSPRTYLDPEAIRDLARAMSSRGLI